MRGGEENTLRRWAIPVLVLSTALIVVLCSIRHTVSRDDVEVAIWSYSLTSISYGALLVMSLGPWSKLFSWPLLRLCGKYSYGLYLYHFSLTTLLEPMKPRAVEWTGSRAAGEIAYVAACLAINFAVAAVSFHFIESPIMRLKARFNYAQRIDRASAH